MADLIDSKGEFFTKDAADVGTFTVDWAPFIGADTITVAPAVWVVPIGITKDTQAQTTTTTSVKLSGGTAGIEYALTVKIVTTAGNTWQRTLRIIVTPYPTLAANALITLDYLKSFLRVYEAEPLDNVDNVLFGRLIDAASDQIENYTSRSFKAADYVHRFTWRQSIELKNYPVQYVRSIHNSTREGVLLTNTATKDYATAWVSGNRKLYLSISGGVSNGIQTIDLTLSANDTLAELIITINAIGSGWGAALASGRSGNERSEDLIESSPRIVDANTGLKLELLGSPLACQYFLNEPAGIVEIESASPYQVYDYRLKSCQAWVKYRAGYDVIPDDLQSLCARAVKFHYENSQGDTDLLSEKIGDYSYTRQEVQASGGSATMLPSGITSELDRWIRPGEFD